MKLKTIVLILLSGVVGSQVQAKVNVYKFTIATSFLLHGSCTIDDKDRTSEIQVRINDADLADAKDIVFAEAKVTACVLGGKFINKTTRLPLPKEFLTGGSVKLGTRSIDDDQSDKFTSMQVSPASGQAGSYEIKYYTDKGLWDVMNPVVVKIDKKGDKNVPTNLQMKIVKKNVTLDAKLRIIMPDTP